MHPPPRGHDVTPREQIAAIAGMQVEIRHLAESIKEMVDRLEVFEIKLDETQQLVDRGRGAWATLVGFGAVAATMATAGTWAFEHLWRGLR